MHRVILCRTMRFQMKDNLDLILAVVDLFMYGMMGILVLALLFIFVPLL